MRPWWSPSSVGRRASVTVQIRTTQGPGMLPGPGGGSVAAEDFGAVGAAGGGSAVRVQGDGPAPLVNRNVVVEKTEQRAIPHRGGAAVGLVGQVVHLTRGGGLVAAAGPAAVLVPQDDRAADRGRDVRAAAHVQRQRRAGQPGAELVLAEEGGQTAGAGDQVHGPADDRVLEHLPGLPARLRARVIADRGLILGGRGRGSGLAGL